MNNWSCWSNRTFTILCVALVLSSCAKLRPAAPRANVPSTTSPSALPSESSPESGTATARNPNDNNVEYVLTEKGLGALTADYPWQQRAELVQKFPNLSMHESYGLWDSDPYPLLSFSDSDRVLFEARFTAAEAHFDSLESSSMIFKNLSFEGGKLAEIVVLSPQVIGPAGVRVGIQFHELLSPGDLLERCTPGYEQDSGKITCRMSDFHHVLFSGEWKGPDGELPPFDICALWRAEALVWFRLW